MGAGSLNLWLILDPEELEQDKWCWEAVGAAKDTGEERQGMRFIIATKTNKGAMISRSRRDVTCVYSWHTAVRSWRRTPKEYIVRLAEKLTERKYHSIASNLVAKEKLGNYCFLSCFRKIQLGARATGRQQKLGWPKAGREKAGLGHLPLNQLGRDNEVLAAEGSGKNRDFGSTHLFRR